MLVLRSCALCLLLLLASISQAEEVPSPLQEYLAQVQNAAQSLDYDGVYVYQQGAMLQAVRLIHVLDGTGEHARLATLDGEARECLRQNDIERCLLPKQQTISEQAARNDHFPGFLLGQTDELENHYEWHAAIGKYRVAGRSCTVSQLKPKDELRYGYRFCTDDDNHLLLRMQTMDTNGAVVDQLSFSTIRLGPDVDPQALESEWDTEGWTIQTEAPKPIDLAAKGWRFVFPQGFHTVAELSRSLGRENGVEQLLISDGLAAISIFIETFDANDDQTIRQGRMSHGALNIYRKRLASYWLTAVGEVPAQTVQDLIQSVEFISQPAH